MSAPNVACELMTGWWVSAGGRQEDACDAIVTFRPVRGLSHFAVRLQGHAGACVWVLGRWRWDGAGTGRRGVLWWRRRTACVYEKGVREEKDGQTGGGGDWKEQRSAKTHASGRTHAHTHTLAKHSELPYYYHYASVTANGPPQLQQD